MQLVQIIILVILLVGAIVCYGVTACYTYIGIGQTDDAAAFYTFGYLLGAGLFALATAITIAFTMPETDTTLALSVVIGITAAALSIGGMATGSITH